jgi:3-deoxy-D-manno-octulosonic-acid transferase
MGKPVLIGEHTFNFSDATEQAVAAGAAIRVNEKDLAEKLSDLMNNAAQQATMGKAALSFSQCASGATNRLMRLISQNLR